MLIFYMTYSSKNLTGFALLFTITLFTFQQHSFAANQRFINTDWEFAKSDSDISLDKLSTLQWQNIHLPHTPHLEPQIVNNQWKGLAFYRKNLSFSESIKHKRVFLRFEAAMNTADVWLNGIHLYRNNGGFLPFTVDITDHLIGSKNNKLLVKLNNHDNPSIGPKPLHLLDFNTYGGIYRNVQLIVKPSLHITDEILADKAGSGGVFVQYPKVSNEEAEISTLTHINNTSNESRSFELSQQLFFGETLITEYAERHTFKAGVNKQLTIKLLVPRPKLWSPKSPSLYRLVTTIREDNRVIDSQDTVIGIREFAFNENNQLLINGQVTFLRGVNRHQEYPYLGYAISDAAQYRDAVHIKSAGFDYVRVAHYPMANAFMHAADELGLVVLNAIPGWQYYSFSKSFNRYIVDSCKKMIRRDRNHPSVLAWECSLNETEMPSGVVANLHQTVKQEYPSAFSAGWVSGYDIYLQARQHRLQHYEEPKVPYIVSEYGDWEYYAQNAGLSQDSWQDLSPAHRNSRQLLSDGEKRLLQQATNIQESHNDNFTTPAFADGYWVMFDYNRGYADDLEASGIMSLFRLPKFSYYFFQSQRSSDEVSTKYDSGPMIYIASNWDKNASLDVRVFSNMPNIKLFLNDEDVSNKRQEITKNADNLVSAPAVFTLDSFEAGELKAVAYENGLEVVSHRVTTPGEPTRIEVSLGLSKVALQYERGDTVFAYAQLKDKDGFNSFESGIGVQFEVTGDIELIGPSIVTTERGIASALLKVGAFRSENTIKVSSPGFNIKSNSATLQALTSKE